MYFEPEAIQHKHQVIREFLREISGVNRNIQFLFDLSHDLLGERTDRRIQFHLLYRAEIGRRAHSRYWQKSEYLLFYREIHMQYSADLIDHIVYAEELSVCCQVVVSICKRPDKMTCEKAVHHQEKVALELPADLLLKRFPCQFGSDQFLNLMVQWIVTV